MCNQDWFRKIRNRFFFLLVYKWEGECYHMFNKFMKGEVHEHK